MAQRSRQYEGDVLYRAKIVNPRGHTHYRGPYDTPAKAKRQVTLAAGKPPREGWEESRVEVARPEWQPIED
ncbi:hypothetical protein ORV05_04770 [Amycolatopsis cynarae]|uniref:SPOR domain-containing protein n=1 Tax=Amycolatopsis cynarae TaxID=2995223 RepID=A0ABY7B6P8_9PSEU|nr:hypothetical protein [Amycolatopsis sp. HUAS 11-8]WAL67104.1 hypothetical protein ORV05_04770 [Amycolatopsis sp. HUAS 11-8]